ncbi:MAG: putative toxin-antitoxin system toxin component, PIN family [Chitinophagaceae bacterium]|nr:putative toxin-antitoxin system toxin component, PIN family [Chitinophagaceae bacterium]
MLRIVLDTNAVLRSVSRRSAYHIVFDKLYENGYQLCISSEILMEYEEKITAIFSEETAELIIGAFSFMENIRKADVHFKLNLIVADPDDNKFSDCAFAANAHYLVTDDRHFNVLRNIPFPSITVITLDEFKSLLEAL